MATRAISRWSRRDNRLNMIHEGAHGIQGMDLLGRKVLMEEGRGLQLLAARMQASIAAAAAHDELAEHAQALGRALDQVGRATRAAWAGGQPAEALANATPYLQAFGHVVLGWIKLAAARYFQRYELPRIGAWLSVVESRDRTCLDLAPEAL
jgi:hypothetical protein